MTALQHSKVAAVVTALRAAPPAAGWTVATLRAAAGLTAAECREAVRVLRNSGRIHFLKLELSPSMLLPEDGASAMTATDSAPPVPSPVAQAGGDASGGVAMSSPEPPAAATGMLADMLANDYFLTIDNKAKGYAPGLPLDAAAAAALLAALDRWHRHARMHETVIGQILFRHPGFVGLLRKRGTARAFPALMVRACMARWPDGVTLAAAQAARAAALARIGDMAHLRSVAAAPGAPLTESVHTNAGSTGRTRGVPAVLPTPGPSAPAPIAPVNPLRDAVAREAAAASVRRRAARSTGSVVHPVAWVDPAGKADDGAIDPPLSAVEQLTLGGQMQALALHGAHLDAAQLLRAQWNPLWTAVCRHAGLTGTRPVPAMLALIEAGLMLADEDRREAGA